VCSAISVLGPVGEIEIEPVDRDGAEWLADGPGGDALGDLRSVLTAAGGREADPDWLDAVAHVLRTELRLGWSRSRLRVERGRGEMFHASPIGNRTSIDRHGLDWARMQEPGIAGSIEAEWPGVFLCSSLEGARFFAAMRAPGHADIWAVRVDGVWLAGAPDDDGGGGSDWVIAPTPFPRDRIRLVRPEAGGAPRP